MANLQAIRRQPPAFQILTAQCGHGLVYLSSLAALSFSSLEVLALASLFSSAGVPYCLQVSPECQAIWCVKQILKPQATHLTIGFLFPA